MNWILFGFKSCGKTTLGKQLAEATKYEFIDTDQLIVPHPKELVLKHSEAHFRKVESAIIQNLKCNQTIISLGGGSILPPENLAYLQSLGTLIYLQCPKEVLKKRIFTPPLPTFMNEDNFEKIYSKRIAIYETIPAHRIHTDDRPLWHLINLVRFSALQPGEKPMAKP